MKRNFVTIAAVSFALVFTACGEEKKQIKKSTTELITKVSEKNFAKGEAIFKDKGCVACHQTDEKVVGPSIKDIATAYKDNLEGLKSFLKEEGEAIVDPTKYSTMQVNLAITKSMSDEDLTSLSEYILSL